MLISHDDSEYSADVMLAIASEVVKVALEQELLVKGAVACGEFTADYETSIFFGKPIIQASQLEEELKSPCIVLHHSCEKKLSELSYKHENPLKNGRCFTHKTNLKQGSVNHTHINWLSSIVFVSESPKEELYEKYKSLIEKVYLQASGHSRVYIDNAKAYIDVCYKNIK